MVSISLPTAAVIAAGVTAAAGAGTAIYSANAASETASKQTTAIRAGQQQATQALSPYADTGAPATRALSDFAGLNGPDAANNAMAMYHTSPGYEFARDEGLRGIDANAAARGMLRSGATEKAEIGYSEGLANQDFGSYLNRLSTYAGQGLQAGANQAQTATGGATQQSSIAGGATTNQTAALGAGVGTVGGALSKYLGTGSVYGSKGTVSPSDYANIWSGNTLSGYSAPSGTGTDAFAGNTLGGFY